MTAKPSTCSVYNVSLGLVDAAFELVPKAAPIDPGITTVFDSAGNAITWRATVCTASPPSCHSESLYSSDALVFFSREP